MTIDLSSLTDILDKIRIELTSKISLAKNVEKVDITTLSQQSKTLNDIILKSDISKENKFMLQKFSLTLQEGITAKSLRYEKQDLERIVSNLTS